ncbi:hypothetical protein Dimus_005741 [Dionaea muscipula]
MAVGKPRKRFNEIWYKYFGLNVVLRSSDNLYLLGIRASCHDLHMLQPPYAEGAKEESTAQVSKEEENARTPMAAMNNCFKITSVSFLSPYFPLWGENLISSQAGVWGFQGVISIESGMGSWVLEVLSDKKDENKVALCIKGLTAPSLYPPVISIWVTDSFERKDVERDLLAKLLVNLTKPRDGMFTPVQLTEGFGSVLTNLEDTVNDAPRAAEFLGRLFGKVIIENIVSLGELGQLICNGGEEPGRLCEVGLAGDILGSILDMIKSDKGESALNSIRAASNLRLQDFLPLDPLKSRKLEMFNVVRNS